MSHFDRHLPVLDNAADGEDESVCSPSIYVSNEEVALLEAMRGLRSRSAELRKELEEADDSRRPALKRELEALRVEWKTLARRREAAYIRKMIMLGHLPPDYLDEREG